ncbi:polysaccharide deacetylase [Hippea maritima DSM 10411]|uniref:Polysaccharide deacetylase n=1 Tax=Hippea maritima (strain ATCC 700847 / DSM 10411 / MH2) TaxID=760142 RepID=F2LW46_HIPMA|nr:polysaccharide deacetylase [Hippea maritima DSM 10411]
MLYYHRILPFKGYDIDVETFEWQLSFLRKHFDVVGPEVLFDLKKGFRLKKTSVLLTFDDGFLDNFVYAYPILEEFGFKALLFVITSKITHRKPLKTVKDSQGAFVPKREETALYDSLNGDKSEFLSWKELKILSDSGVFSIGSHSDSHVKVFIGDRAKAIWHDNTSAHWSYEYALGRKAKEGYPIFEMRSSLGGRRFYPSDEFIGKVRDLYLKYGDEKRVLDEVNSIKDKGYFESKDEFKYRVRADLEKSKLAIKENLGINTPFFSFPWGEYCKESVDIAKDLGFEFCFTTKKSAFFGNDFLKIGRINVSKDKNRFKRKLLSNKNPLVARMYALWHA